MSEKSVPDAEEFDFLVIGSGVAGLFTALHLADHGRTAVITKDILTESNTEYAQGGIAVSLCPKDTPEDHERDTLAAGAGLCDVPAVRVLTQEGPDAVRELMRLGMRFDRTNGELTLAQEAAHSRRRILHASGDETGHEVERALTRRTRIHPDIEILEHTQVTGLLVLEGRCLGVDAIVDDGGERRRFLAPATLLATGGLGQLYPVTTNPLVTTGDGLAVAYRAGAALRDMEFVQFHPTALDDEGSPKFLISEAVRGEGAVLLNEAGERFMPGVHPLGELAPRDIVARAVAEQMRNAAGHVYLDFSPIPPDRIQKRFPGIIAECHRRGFDVYHEPIPVAPAAHYMMGGVNIDLSCHTDLPGLLAVGECACAGVHGANRLASNSMLEGMVFGLRAAEVARKLAGLSAEQASQAAHLPEAPVRYAPPTLRGQLQELMDVDVGLERSSDSLGRASEALAAWSKQVGSAPLASREEIETANLLLVGRLVVAAALTREESRGAHYRTDFPEASDDWRHHLVLRLGPDGQPLIEPMPVLDEAPSPHTAD